MMDLVEDVTLKTLLRERRVERLLAQELRAQQEERTRRIEWALAARERREMSSSDPLQWANKR
jgi:hypothetical protein